MTIRPFTSRIKAPSPIVQAAVVLAAAGAFASWQFTHRPVAPLAAPRTIVQRIVQKATGAIVLDRPTALEVLQKNAAALAAHAQPGVFTSGAMLPQTGFGTYLQANGYATCAGYTCSLTAKGRAKHWLIRPAIMGLVDVVVPLYAVRVDRITGISGGLAGYAAGVSVVDFDATETPNDVGRANGLHEHKARGQAAFTKYDDGYRLADVSLSTGPTSTLSAKKVIIFVVALVCIPTALSGLSKVA